MGDYIDPQEITLLLDKSIEERILSMKTDLREERVLSSAHVTQMITEMTVIEELKGVIINHIKAKALRSQ